MVCKTFPLVIATAMVFSSVAPPRSHAATPAPSAQAVFAAMKAATGGNHWDALAELEQRSTLEQGGQHGRCKTFRDLLDGRSAMYCTLGQTPGGQGYDGMHSWFMDEKFMVSVRESIQAKREAATDAYLARNGWFRGAASDPAQMQYVGQQREAGRTFDVVRVVPKGGMAFDAWVDARTHLLDRVVEDNDDGSREITRYTDYRPVDGVLISYAQRQGDGKAQYDQISQVQEVRVHAAPDQSHFAMPSSTVHDAHMDGDASSATVPFTSYAGLIMVSLAIDDAKPLPFLLDTGGLNLLTPAAARKLGIAGAGHQAVQGVGEATQSMQTARVKRYRLGAVVMEDQQFLIVDLPRLLTDRGAQEPIAGIIGYELLRRFATRVDYDHDTLTFTPVSLFHGVPDVPSVPIVFNDRTPQVQARVNGRAGTFNLDTGDTGELTLFAPFARANGIQLHGKLIRNESRGAGGKIAVTQGQVDSLSIGPLTVSHPVTDLASPSQGMFASSLLAGNIGYGILSRFALTFDYEHRQLYLEKGGHFTGEAPRNRAGVGLDRLEHDALVVATLEQGSPGAEAGLHVGDRVVAIDDVPVADMGLDDIRRALQQPAGTRMQMHIVRGGKHVLYALTLR